jgi:hypothetical protein
LGDGEIFDVDVITIVMERQWLRRLRRGNITRMRRAVRRRRGLVGMISAFCGCRIFASDPGDDVGVGLAVADLARFGDDIGIQQIGQDRSASRGLLKRAKVAGSGRLCSVYLPSERFVGRQVP